MGVLVTLIALLGVATLWLANSTSGARWLLARSDSMLAGTLRIEGLEGSLASPLTLANLSYRDPDAGIDVTVRHVELELALLALLRATVRIESAEIAGMQLTLSEPRAPQPDPEPISLDPPLDVVVEALLLRDAVIRRDNDTLAEIRTARLNGTWTRAQLAIRELDVDAADGRLQLTGRITGNKPYAGEAQGEFQWQLGERTVAGTLTLSTADSRTTAQLQLTKPMTADLRATLLHQGERTAVDGVIRFGEGRLNVDGTLNATAKPLAVDLKLSWRDMLIPEDLAGQVLETTGDVAVSGNLQQYAIDGRLALGPPGRTADLQLKLTGSTDAIELERLAIVQRDGRLSATGRVAWQPGINWQIDATARSFDPGEFWVRWPGALDFTLASSGQFAAEQMTGHLEIDRLRGMLRGTPIRGSADLSLLTDRMLIGTLELQANNSRLRVNSQRIRQTGTDAFDAVAELTVPSLADWLPDAAGKATARFTARGAWPTLDIAGDLAGSAIRVGAQSAELVTASIALANPLEPDGEASLIAQNLTVAGFGFSSLNLSVRGDAEQHSLTADLKGPDQSAALSLQGSLEDANWRATVSRLQIAATDVATLALQQPTEVLYSAAGTSLARTCLVDGDMRICLAGSLQATGAFRADYELANVPLALTQIALAEPLPVTIEGSIDGTGELQRAESGVLTGAADLRSSGGALRQAAIADQPGAPLIRYQDLALQLALAERGAELTLSARLDDDGNLAGRIETGDLTADRTTLTGTMTARLPSVAVIEVLTPQLVDVNGSATLQAALSGTLQQPELSGELQVSGFAAEVPRLGLKLRDGKLTVKPQTEGPFLIAGQLRSGEGQLQFDGTATMDAEVRMAIKGQDFLAADFPGVRVVATPDLVFQRTAEEMSLIGYVRLPRADINLARLPRGTRPQSASDDVVVVDAVDRQTDAAQGSPLSATIRIEFGEQVAISGYGLDADVSGALMVRERPGSPTTGSGEVRVSGTYKAYGQDLTIRQGQLLYAGTPLDDPRLTIVAVREVGTVTAGIRVAGNAKNPQLSVFSDPAMGQANALSYLVAGKPMDEIGAGEGDAMTAAARSLGTAAGGLLAKNIGNRLGLDEVGIADSEMLGGAALTVGQYLSPRLYLSYGVGLFEPGEVLTLRYKLTDELALKVEQAAERSRGGIEYRIEK